MHPRFPNAALVAVTAGLLALAACEQAPAPAPSAPAAPAAPAAAAPAPVPAGPGRKVAVELTEGGKMGALQIDVKYVGEGRFVGDADAVACESKLENSQFAFNHIVDQKTLRAAFITVGGFQAPARVVECRFVGEAKVEDFTVSVRDSSSPELQPVEPPPAVKVVLD